MIIAVINNKGGVGKTTTTVHVGYALAQLGKRVLCVDMDGQANLLMHLFDLNKVYQLEDEKNAPTHTILHHASGVDVLPLSYWKADRKQYIKAIQAAAKKYDITLIDCPPSLGILTLNAFAAADANAARAVIARDDEIDRLYDRIFHELLDRMSKDAAAAGRAARLLLVAKHLERIGDYVTDICEQIVYLAEAQVIKHPRLREKLTVAA